MTGFRALRPLLCLFVVVSIGSGLAAAARQAQPQKPAPQGLAGQVTAAKAPLAGVSVKVAPAGTQNFVATGTTDQEGKYRLVPIERGVYRVEFRKDGYEPVIRWGIVVLDDTVSDLSVTMTKAG